MAKIGLAFKFGLHRRRPRMICEGFFISFKITAIIETNNFKAKYFLFSHISLSDFNVKLFLMYSKRLKNPQNVFLWECFQKTWNSFNFPFSHFIKVGSSKVSKFDLSLSAVNSGVARSRTWKNFLVKANSKSNNLEGWRWNLYPVFVWIFYNESENVDQSASSSVVKPQRTLSLLAFIWMGKFDNSAPKMCQITHKRHNL